MEQDNIVHQNRSKNFIKAIGLYAIGNLGSKLITFLMVPLYTYFVNPIDYGFYDLSLTLIFFAIPFMTLQLRDGAFRFLVDNKDEERRKVVVSFAYRVMFLTSIIAIILGTFVEIFMHVRHLWLMLMLLIVMSFYEVVVQMSRGLGNTVSFVWSGIISSIGIGVFSVLFVVCLEMGIKGVFLANILARLVALFFIEIKDKILKFYFIYKPNYGTIRKEIIKYSLPLMPGVVFWWILGSSDRIFIEHFFGLSENGIYAVSYRLVSILQVLLTIFYQAWQETAITQYNSADRDCFFSEMFNNYIYLLSCILIIFIFVLKINYGWLVSKEFAGSVQYLYPMAVSVFIFALVAFMDMGYQCTKDTKRTLPGIIIAAVVNIISNIILVKTIGLWGIICSSILSYTVLLIYRIHDMKRYFKLSIYNKTMIPCTMLLLSGLCYYVLSPMWCNVLYVFIVILVMIYAMPTKVLYFIKSKVKTDNKI